MTMFAPAFAFDEQHRAEGLAVRAEEITTTPGHPSADSLHLYQESARKAFETAAANAVQPDEGWRL
ncbi:hypothetical protein [Streptomyces rubiginosohelvolus]|uniref:hypothetical protein n=1 Tax=Streptomyces rubiginosohelvolus TaxID=67362 RepID=UPI003650FF05